jgi:hypothetical protein
MKSKFGRTPINERASNNRLSALASSSTAAPARSADAGNTARFGCSDRTTACLADARPLKTSYTVRNGRWIPTPLLAFACGSRSTSRIRRRSARAAERFTAVVVLPTPPF